LSVGSTAFCYSNSYGEINNSYVTSTVIVSVLERWLGAAWGSFVNTVCTTQSFVWDKRLWTPFVTECQIKLSF